MWGSAWRAARGAFLGGCGGAQGTLTKVKAVALKRKEQR
jgi:hypothetical protein